MRHSTSTVRVLSADCTHVLPDEGLQLPGGEVTEIPAKHLSRVLALPGVSEVPTPEPEHLKED